MYFGVKEIESVVDNVITFKDGTTLLIEEKNKSLMTDEPMEASQLQTFWRMSVAQEIFDVLIVNNVRMSDIQAIFQYTTEKVEEKYNEGVSRLIGKDKLDVLARAFGTKEEVVPALSAHNVRIKDLF
jgi:hypothetical protein